MPFIFLFLDKLKGQSGYPNQLIRRYTSLADCPFKARMCIKKSDNLLILGSAFIINENRFLSKVDRVGKEMKCPDLYLT
jgi:hypothetical protein